MTRYKIKSTTFDERDGDFTAGFTITNTQTDATVDLTVRQDKGKPATDLVGSLRALAELFHRVNRSDDSDVQTLN